MSNDSNITIQQFINKMNTEKTSAATLAKEHLNLMNVKNKITDLLNECGYLWNIKKQQWMMIEDKSITESMTFEQFVLFNDLSSQFRFKNTNNNIKVTAEEVEEVAPTIINKVTESVLSDDEIEILRKIIYEYEHKKEVEELPKAEVETVKETNGSQRKKKESINAAINQLGRNAKNVRRTILLDEDLSNALSKYANKKEVKLSDVVSVAIKNLLNEY